MRAKYFSAIPRAVYFPALIPSCNSAIVISSNSNARASGKLAGHMRGSVTSTLITGATAAAKPPAKPFCKNALRPFSIFKAAPLLKPPLKRSDITTNMPARRWCAFPYKTKQTAGAASAAQLAGSKPRLFFCPSQGDNMDAPLRPFLLTRGIPRLLLLCALLVGSTVVALGQSTATLSGTVTDASGGTVPNAKVVATNQATDVASVTQTDAAGSYLFPSLPIGVYRIEVRCPGFRTASVSNLKLEVATAATQNIQLEVGQASQRIEIVADATVLETSTTSMGQVINEKTVQDIPLNGRHFTDLSLLTPGTITPPANGFLSFPLRGQGSFGINTAGQREDTTNWMVNGINMNDNVQNQITFQPPIDTLAEYKIDNSSFPAEYGRNAGAIVNLATRSGTSDYHGELFEFFRNNALDARNFFNLAS